MEADSREVNLKFRYVKKNKLLVIVPDLPPNVNGVGDYGFILGSGLGKLNEKVDVQFLIAGNLNFKSRVIDGFLVHTIEKHSAICLFEKLIDLEFYQIHLHFVGYAYEKRGIPFWLYFGIRKWKLRTYGKLIVTFHELYATSIKPWTSSFWNQYFQKWLCKKLFVYSDVSVTSRNSYRQQLIRFSSSKQVISIPVFSNFCETEMRVPLCKRNRNLVVLGSAANRNALYHTHLDEIINLCQILNLDCIIDIGPPVNNKLDLPPIINCLGILTPEEVRKVLMKSFAGVVGSSSERYLAKSGVFASLAAFGVIPIVLNVESAESSIESEIDGLFRKVNYLCINDVENIDTELISKSAFEWYSDHTINSQIKMYESIVLSSIEFAGND